ncbi:MAG: hypothetical protein E7517_00260 [Ruminococcaceae bacterium]|nr:hypothetical protein [Oscillospiraceae bacterium]
MDKIDKKLAIKKIIGAVIFILLLALVLLIISYFFAPQKDKSITMQDVKPNGILAEKDQTIDVILFGDSEAYTAFSPIQMWRDNGFPSFVCASSSQYVSLTESFVHQALEHQTPKVVILETNAFYRKMRSDNAFITRVENMFSVLQYHNRWKTLCPLKLDKNVNYNWKDDMKGYKYAKLSTKGNNKEYMIKTDEIEPIPETNARYVGQIADYCRKKGVKVLLVSTPSSKNWNYKRHNAVAALAQKIGTEYLDLNLQKEIQIDWHTDTADAGDHLNFRGTKKVCAFLGDYLAKTYHLADKRNDPAYQEWNDLITKYEYLTAENK